MTLRIRSRSALHLHPSRIGRRAARCAVAVSLVAATASSGAPAGAAPGGPVRYRAPVPQPRVVDAFDTGTTTYGPGHRGADLLVAQGDPVTAAADGVVSFAGAVAGRGVVVVLHPDGLRTTYEPVEPAVARGAPVQRGQVIAVVAGGHGGRTDALHWGARRGEAYLDPMQLLRPLGIVRLVPSR